MQNVMRQVVEVIIGQLGVQPDQVTAATTFRGEPLYCDSLDVIELIMAAEEEFAIEIPDGDVAAFVTVGDAVTYITRRIAEKAK